MLFIIIAAGALLALTVKDQLVSTDLADFGAALNTEMKTLLTVLVIGVPVLLVLLLLVLIFTKEPENVVTASLNGAVIGGGKAEDLARFQQALRNVPSYRSKRARLPQETRSFFPRFSPVSTGPRRTW